MHAFVVKVGSADAWSILQVDTELLHLYICLSNNPQIMSLFRHQTLISLNNLQNTQIHFLDLEMVNRNIELTIF